MVTISKMERGTTEEGTKEKGEREREVEREKRAREQAQVSVEQGFIQHDAVRNNSSTSF